MIVYADVLMVLNGAVDALLLLLAARLARCEVRRWRLVAACLMGAVASLTVFLPPIPALAQIGLDLLLGWGMAVLAVGMRPLSRSFRMTGYFWAVTLGYGGAMTALYTLLHPRGMMVYNGSVYFSVSPVALIGFTVIGYLAAMAFRHRFGAVAPKADRCRVTLTVGVRQQTVTGLLDTGNSLEDLFGCGEVLIIHRRTAESLFGEIGQGSANAARYRAIPCRTVTGAHLLDGYRADRADLEWPDGRKQTLIRPILALSQTASVAEDEVLINPASVAVFL